MNYSFWVSFYYTQDGKNGHGGVEMMATIIKDHPGDRWTITSKTLLDWTEKIKKTDNLDGLVIIAISPMFGHF